MPNPGSCNYHKDGSASCNVCSEVSECFCQPTCECFECTSKKVTVYRKANDCPCGAWRETYTWQSGTTVYVPYPIHPECTCE